MSVLLEALKKAAEEKMKQAASSAHHGAAKLKVTQSSEQDSIESHISASHYKETGVDNDPVFEQPLALKFNFEVEKTSQPDNSDLEQDIKMPQKMNDVATDFAIPIETLDNPSSVRSNEIAVSDDDYHGSSSQEKVNDAGGFRLQDSVQGKLTVSDDLETRLAVSEFDSNMVSSVDDINDDIDSRSILPPGKEEYEVVVPSSWETLHSESLLADKTVDKGNETEASVKIVGSEEKPVSTSERQEHDWSLEQIPGYQRYSSTESQQKKSRLILSHLISKKSHLPSKWRAYFFSGILVLLGFAYYAMLYFDQQSSVIDADLQRYQVFNEPRLVEPTMPSHAELQAKAALLTSQQDIKQTNVTQAKPVSNKVIESKTLNKTVEIKIDKTPSKSQKQASDNKPELVAQTLPRQIKPKVIITSRAQENAVSLAFKAYQRSDWQSARRFYQQAYEEDSRSLPALFGLGAVAVQLGEQNKALAYYRKVLALEPENQLAQKAMLSIQSLENSNQRTIDELKSLAEANPNDSEVTFALGNAYAKRKDWVTAQSYYFKAYQHNPALPIYVLNLAVSLDQLGEYRLAKQYYDEALAKSSASSRVFDIDSIKKRLIVLNHFLSREK